MVRDHEAAGAIPVTPTHGLTESSPPGGDADFTCRLRMGSSPWLSTISACSSAAERTLDKREVVGANPARRTRSTMP